MELAETNRKKTWQEAKTEIREFFAYQFRKFHFKEANFVSPPEDNQKNRRPFSAAFFFPALRRSKLKISN